LKGTRLNDLKDWGAAPEGGEIFRTAKLPEFSSTDFVATSAVSIMRSGSPLLEGLPAKKRKLDSESLYQLIPQVKGFSPSL
jgi:hypothetical protein